MRRMAAVAAMAAVGAGAAAGCRGTSDSASRATPPRGDAIWLSDPRATADPALEDQLQRLAPAAVFLPAGEVAFEGGRWALRRPGEPEAPLGRTPVILVVTGRDAVASALSDPEGPGVEGIVGAVSTALAPAAAAGGPFGKVIGVHLDFPFGVASAERSAELLGALRRALPKGLFFSITLRSVPSDEADQKKLAPLAEAADALVAFVFGLDARADPAAVDALRRPWWAGYGVSARGERTNAAGSSGEAVAERYLSMLAGHPDVEFENDLSRPDADVWAFRLTARRPVRLEGLTLEAGDHVGFRAPSVPEMLYQLGAAVAGKRHALGRVVAFEGTSDAERLFSLAALEDVLLGRGLAPVLEVATRPASRGVLEVGAVNRSRHGSTASRMSNWVEVDLGASHPADVLLGGFDRYVAFDSAGRSVTPGRATRIRLFETLVTPGETIEPARIVIRGGVPSGCCRYRSSVIAASGAEVAVDWAEPPVPPTPTRRPKKGRR